MVAQSDVAGNKFIIYVLLDSFQFFFCSAYSFDLNQLKLIPSSRFVRGKTALLIISNDSVIDETSFRSIPILYIPISIDVTIAIVSVAVPVD